LQGSTAETLGKVVDRVKRWTTEQRRP